MTSQTIRDKVSDGVTNRMPDQVSNDITNRILDQVSDGTYIHIYEWYSLRVSVTSVT